MSLDFFDCNCSIGRSSVLYPGSFHSPEDLVERMKAYGIDRALVYQAIARDHFPAEGNPILMENVSRYKELYPCWIIMPHHTGEFPDPSELLSQLKINNVRAVRIFPSGERHNYSIKPYSAGPMLRMLEEQSIPLFVDIDEIGWDNIDALLGEYPSLPVILCNTGYRSDRYIYPLMKTYKNMYIETSRYLSHLGIEALYNEVGVDRILFGTGMPVYTGAGAVFYIKKLLLGEEDKQKIASVNLTRLLNGVKL
jgi:hypothetical protein